MSKSTRRHLRRMFTERGAKLVVAGGIAIIGLILIKIIVNVTNNSCEIPVIQPKVVFDVVETEEKNEAIEAEVQTKVEIEAVEAEDETETVETEIAEVETKKVVTEVVKAEAEDVNISIVETDIEEKDCNEDVLLLAQLMHAEEGVLRYKLSYDDAKLAHMYAGSVVLHRLEQHYMGAESIEDVIYAPGQYACISKLDQEVPEETIEWARELIEDGPIGPETMIYQAEFEQGSETVAHIGNQYFCTK